jgi:hypothetical protein
VTKLVCGPRTKLSSFRTTEATSLLVDGMSCQVPLNLINTSRSTPNTYYSLKPYPLSDGHNREHAQHNINKTWNMLLQTKVEVTYSGRERDGGGRRQCSGRAVSECRPEHAEQTPTQAQPTKPSPLLPRIPHHGSPANTRTHVGSQKLKPTWVPTCVPRNKSWVTRKQKHTPPAVHSKNMCTLPWWLSKWK